MSQKIGIGLYGGNGHQLSPSFLGGVDAQVLAVAALDPAMLEQWGEQVSPLDQLEGLLVRDDLQLISLCSPRRDQQANDAISCLEAGKHVYAEKPCALSERDLDRVIDAARLNNRIFHEMGAAQLSSPYDAVAKVISNARVGEVVQVFAQKAYPWTTWRAADEGIDGGLALQAGIYITRFVEHVAGQKIDSISLNETAVGNDHADSACKRACSFAMTFENGGLGTGVVNYCCPESWPNWGYETLRVFGEKGFVESIDNGRHTNLCITGQEVEPLMIAESTQTELDLFVKEVQGLYKSPQTLEQELSPTRWVIRAKECLSRV